MICALGFKVARPFSRRQGRMITHRGDVLLRAITKGGKASACALGNELRRPSASTIRPCRPLAPCRLHRFSHTMLAPGFCRSLLKRPPVRSARCRMRAIARGAMIERPVFAPCP